MPLEVLASTRSVVDAARDVRIDAAALQRLADRLEGQKLTRPPWKVALHWCDDGPATANYVLALDALNFSFWGDPRWRVCYAGSTYDGYWALAAALRRGIAEGWPLLDATALAAADCAEVAHLLRGEHEVPLLAERARCLRELGRVLNQQFDGQASNLIAEAGCSAARLVELVVEHFGSFRDIAFYDGRQVPFFKRAQIFVSDLVGAYDGAGLGRFDDLETLTAFADYKIPQVLRAESVLVYSSPLASAVDSQQQISAGHPWEVEIRAATIWAVELLARALASRGREILAFELDWLLWSETQGRQLPSPYHRTRTIYY